MSKLTLLVLIAAAVIAYLSGVFEVVVHPERVSQIPATVQNITKDGSLIVQAKTYVTKLKRKGELILADTPDRKLELAVGYEDIDAEHLAQQLDKEADPKSVLPQAELLLESMKQVDTYIDDAKVETFVAVQDKHEAALILAADSLAKLKDIQQEYEAYQERLAQVTSSLEEEVGQDIKSEEGEVAGSTTDEEQEETSSDIPASRIPLKF